jgi:hypothetical protein
MNERVVTNVSHEHALGTEWSYEQFLLGIQESFQNSFIPFFTVDTDELWSIYLKHIPTEVRQSYDCNTCRHFIERFGGIVSLNSSTYETKSVIWDPKHGMPDVLRDSVKYLKETVESRSIKDVFITNQSILGIGQTDDFRHPSISVPDGFRYKGPYSVDQLQAQKREDIKTLCLALASYKLEDFTALVRLFRSESVSRHEKFAAHATWLYSLKKLDESRSVTYRHNKIWYAIATAQDGWCHLHSSVLGTMLDDLASGLPIPQVIVRAEEKLDPTKYQRPQEAPKAGNLIKAEAQFQQLGLATALERRFARLDEVQALWRPELKVPPVAKGVFGDVKARDEMTKTPAKMPTVRMTWSKFERTVLSFVDQIDVYVPLSGNFVALTTAVHSNAKPLIRWDREDRRNPVSHYLYTRISSAAQWKLVSGWYPCAVISKTPCAWFDGRDDYPGRLFFIDGAIDTAINNSALFPETIRADLHGVRSVIEAWSNTHKLTTEVEHAASALYLDDSHPIRIRTRGPEGEIEYVLDRLE